MLSYDPTPVPMKGPQSPTSMPLSPSVSGPSSPVRTAPSASLNASVAMGKNGAASGAKQHQQHQHQEQHIWLVTGPAGCGKSTVAEYLADTLSMPYIEGDSYHPPSNVEKMRNGTPLTDADRWDWLTALREEATHRIEGGADGVVVTCSALKRKYRDVIRVAGYFDHRLAIHFIFLDAPEEVLMQRVQKRQNHYMGASMVHSQFDILERPTADEKDVTTIDVSGPIDGVKRTALSDVLETMS